MIQINHLLPQKATPLSDTVFNNELPTLQGGRFELGFISAFTSSLALSYTTGKSNDPLAIMGIGAAIGGTAEALGGGKFANGAVTGAFVGLFNHGMHPPQKKVPSQQWLEQKAQAIIEWERNREQGVINNTKPKGQQIFDLNFPGFSNDESYYGWANDPASNKVTIEIEGKQYTANFDFRPSTENPRSNLVTSLTTAGVSGYYGASFVGSYQIILNSHVWGNSVHHVGILYMDKEAYQAISAYIYKQ